MSEPLHELLRVIVADVVRETLQQLDLKELTNPIVYDSGEAARLMHCKKTTIQTAYRTGKLAGAKCGKKLIFTREALLDWHRDRELLM